MSRTYFLLLLFLCYFQVILCQTSKPQETSTDKSNDDQEEEFTKFNSSHPHCFRFTWLGPQYDKNSEVNVTCKGLTEKFKLKDTPCRQPLVVTHEGTPPDMDYLWERHRDNVLCRMAKGQACVKYSYSFNNELQNVTYMCAKVISIDEGVVTKGCYTQTVNGYEIEACVCESQSGNYKPCNTATRYLMAPPILILSLILFYFR